MEKLDPAAIPTGQIFIEVFFFFFIIAHNLSEKYFIILKKIKCQCANKNI